MKEKIKEHVENNIKDDEWCNVVREIYELITRLIAEGKSLEDACNEVLKDANIKVVNF